MDKINIDKGLTLHHYKEPLKKIKNGYGYFGTLMSTKDGSKIQCHICGLLFADLPKHFIQSHDISTSEYRERFQLARLTALCSEQERMRRKENYLKWLLSMSSDERDRVMRERKLRLNRVRKKRGNFQPKESLETKNKKGTCPDQLIDQIRIVAERLGKTPSKSDFIYETGTQRYVHLIYKTFGSWSNALKIAKLAPVEQRLTGHRNYSDEELIEYMQIFTQENNKIPTATDFKRGFLPSYDCYIRRWGCIEAARQACGVYNFVDKATSPFSKTKKTKGKHL